jgi:hypothetical protein
MINKRRTAPAAESKDKVVSKAPWRWYQIAIKPGTM